MRVAVCVDDSQTRVTLSQWITKYSELYGLCPEVSLFSEADGLMKAQEEQPFPVVFVGLRGPDGFRSARRVREMNRASRMVYVADTMEYAVPCIRFHFADYLLMPLSFKAFVRSAKLAGMGV